MSDEIGVTVSVPGHVLPVSHLYSTFYLLPSLPPIPTHFRIKTVIKVSKSI